jgi:chromosome partitioning protein
MEAWAVNGCFTPANHSARQRAEALMAVVTIMNPKGGAGKSTLTLVLAQSFLARGARVTVVDADQHGTIVSWARKRQQPLRVVGDLNDESFIDTVRSENSKADLVLIDNEGVSNVMSLRAIALAHLILVPLQASPLDAAQAAKAILTVRGEEKLRGKSIPLRAVLTKTSPQVPTKTTKEIIAQLEKQHVPMMRTQLHQRVAFVEVFKEGVTLAELDPGKVNGLAQAIANANTLADELTTVLRGIAEGRAVANG